MMALGSLLETLPEAEVRGDSDPTRPVEGIVFDSRLVVPGVIFVCVVGLTSDGHEFAGQAVAAGALALVVERWMDFDVLQVRVKDSRKALARLADLFYGHPSGKLRVVGVTGTNGKTSVNERRIFR